MTFEEIEKSFNSLKDEKNAIFCAKLTPSILPITGARVPELKKLAAKIAKGDFVSFIRDFKEEFLEHRLLKAYVFKYAKMDFDTAVSLFLPLAERFSNWNETDALCQSFIIAKSHRAKFLPFLIKLSEQNREFSLRAVAVLLLSHYQVQEYMDIYFELLTKLDCEKYYVQMGVSWAVTTALASFSQKTKEFILKKTLLKKTFLLTVKKANESFRVSKEDKDFLNDLKKSI